MLLATVSLATFLSGARLLYVDMEWAPRHVTHSKLINNFDAKNVVFEPRPPSQPSGANEGKSIFNAL